MKNYAGQGVCYPLRLKATSCEICIIFHIIREPKSLIIVLHLFSFFAIPCQCDGFILVSWRSNHSWREPEEWRGGSCTPRSSFFWFCVLWKSKPKRLCMRLRKKLLNGWGLTSHKLLQFLFGLLTTSFFYLNSYIIFNSLHSLPEWMAIYVKQPEGVRKLVRRLTNQLHCVIICRSFCVWFVSRIQ